MDKFHQCMQSYITNKEFHKLSSAEGADKFITLLEECGCKFIAFDFDATMIELHSGGYIDPEIDRKVLESLTADFKSVAERLKNSPIQMAVVTYSDAVHVEGHPRYISGDRMVRLALKYSNCDADIKKVYAYYPRFWDTPKMYKKLGLDAPMPLFKEFHLRSICTDFNVKLDEIILIDDDINNCVNAKQIGVTTLHVTGDGFKLKELSLL
ncbi:hypothetical protein MACJ_004057 [Theileria orientalis]|uniref:Uncharacterized protein n=1 Tax=Theileria orientalis TaxID=68886 RepID=A0A976SL41_THEOR|nr:hypothetical protein MACJ_004057 [Theileria orientalis]